MKKFRSLILILLVFQFACTDFALAQKKFKPNTFMQNGWTKKADSMVKFQIEKRGVKNTDVLQVMRTTPRHLFVPPALSSMAYDDYPLPIGEEQTISQPFIVALMTELLSLEGNEKILEIGTGSGYQAAILSQLVDTVYTIEIVESLAKNAKKRLKKLDYNNVIVKHGDGYQGWSAFAPFDAIIVTAAPKTIPQTLIDQLKIGGKITVPVGNELQELQLITKIDEHNIKKKSVIPVRFVPMVHPAEK